MNYLYFITLILILLTSCGNKNTTTTKLNNINNIEIPAIVGAYKMAISINGKVDCPTRMIVLMNGKKTNDVFELSGEIREYYTADWYEDEMGFILNPSDCVGEEATVKVTIYD